MYLADQAPISNQCNSQNLANLLYQRGGGMIFLKHKKNYYMTLHKENNEFTNGSQGNNTYKQLSYHTQINDLNFLFVPLCEGGLIS